LAGEHEVLGADGNHQVVRSSGLYGIRPCRAKGGNFIDTMYRVAAQQPEVRVVNDEVLTPTFTADLAAQIRVLALDGPPGLFHATNQGSCSWYEFARAIFEIARLETPLHPTTVKEFQSPVQRPFYSVLDNAAPPPAGAARRGRARRARSPAPGASTGCATGATRSRPTCASASARSGGGRRRRAAARETRARRDG